jgi:hypothetical protein
VLSTLLSEVVVAVPPTTESACPAPTDTVVLPTVAVNEPETQPIVEVGPADVKAVAIKPTVPRTAICEVGVLKR